jgi:toxin ParE1/3/4
LRLVWTRPALADLRAIGVFLVKESPGAALRQRDMIRAALGLLPDHPASGRPGRVAGTRELVIGGTPFVVPYRVRDDRVEILAIFHTSLRWPDGF